eukprot:TRINITY_DN2944_c1_g2_i1.p1 TRINITY_DN2944_c1_g2~~TRINITY_DN2944_c1_g2_i1.p1  ORF type:complete len:374 (-),score=58.28 TRINITY_DN2944_c1_g2_i1:61-1182(-)
MSSPKMGESFKLSLPQKRKASSSQVAVRKKAKTTDVSSLEAQLHIIQAQLAKISRAKPLYSEDPVVSPQEEVDNIIPSPVKPKRRKSVPKKPSPPISPPSQTRRTASRAKKRNPQVKLTEPLKCCSRLINQLMRHSMAWPFNQPVDPNELGIPDYFDIIKQPMDLRTIKENLLSGVYANALNFAEDVRLVWKNALTYNQSGSDICIMAQTMSVFFESKFSKVSELEEKQSAPQTPIVETVTRKSKTIVKPPETPSKEKDEMLETIAEIKDSMRKAKKQLQELTKRNVKRKTPSKAKRSSTKRKPAAKNVKRKAEVNVKPMTTKQKNRLSQAINNLALEDLPRVVAIIDEEMPQVTKAIILLSRCIHFGFGLLK